MLQDKVFAMFQALGTPTHLAVVNSLNSEKVPDLFVASGCNCWNNVAQYPYTFGWQPDYTIEGKILGAYVAQELRRPRRSDSSRRVPTTSSAATASWV